MMAENLQILRVKLSSGFAEMTLPVQMSQTDVTKLHSLLDLLVFGSEQSVAVQPAKQPCELVAVWVTKYGPRKLEAIKLVREYTGCGLAEAKVFVESLPRLLGAGFVVEAAHNVQLAFEAIGATVELR